MDSKIDKPKILIVDDIPENITVLKNALATLDLEIHSALSGNEALKATLYNDFSLILLDILMPGMSGLEVADVLKQDDATSDIPIIFITAMDKDESCELKAYSKGAVDFIYKPLNLAVLLSKVKVLLDLYSMKKNIEDAFERHEMERPKILIIDDTPENILVLKKILGKLDVDLVEASSGNEALVQTLYNDFAVIFLDVQMPGMDGYEVAEILKADDKTAGIPIIFITAIDRDDTKEVKGYDKGAVDFIFKPFNEFILLSKAKVFLEIYKMRAGLEALVADRSSALIESNRRLKKENEDKESAEQDLLQARTYLTSVLNSISSVLIGTDAEGTIVQMNMEAEKLSAVSLEDAKGRSVYEVFPFFSAALAYLIEKAALGRPVEKNNIPVSTGGRKSIFNFAVFPLVGTQTNQVVIRIDDVTEAVQMESELHQRRHMESLGQLAGGVAHDFNNMLSAIMGAAELMRIKSGDDSNFLKPIGSILTSVERAADLTGKLLSFARKKGSDRKAVDLHRLVNDTVSILQRSIDKRIRIIVELGAPQSIVMGDDSELSNALLNLAINARDAMPEGGVLQIMSDNKHSDELPENRKHGLQEGRYIELCVTDTGTGMTEEVMRKAFDPFFTTKEPGRGTGLGLSSVYGTIKAHDGSILMESVLEEGSTFTIYLPVCEERGDEEKQTVKGSSDAKLTGTVLLVDDEDIVRSIGRDLLVELGMNVMTAENGRQAIDIVKKKKDELSLILLDMVMPEMNGTDCYKELRKIAPEVKVIMCSGYAPEEMIAELRLEGFDGFLQKPYRLEKLKEMILSRRHKGES